MLNGAASHSGGNVKSTDACLREGSRPSEGVNTASTSHRPESFMIK
jgi:hypothetical protein